MKFSSNFVHVDIWEERYIILKFLIKKEKKLTFIFFSNYKLTDYEVNKSNL